MGWVLFRAGISTLHDQMKYDCLAYGVRGHRLYESKIKLNSLNQRMDTKVNVSQLLRLT